mgnify:CR=1 FL=1
MHKIPEDIKDIENRISKLKKDKKYLSEDNKYTELSRLSIGLQIAIELVSGTIVGAGIGFLLDKLFDFEFLFLVLFTILGGIAGFMNVINYIKHVNNHKEKE